MSSSKQIPFWLASLTIVLCHASLIHAQSELRYQPAANEQFAYEIEIQADLPSKIAVFKGMTRYTVNSSTAEQIQLTYSGGLPESTRAKPSAEGNRGPFGRGFGPFGPGFGPGGPPSPFSRPTFAGRTHTTNQITMTPRGNVLAMKGDSQLPYLLGNASLLPFEILPSGNEKQWKYGSGISVEQKSENRDGPFGPFGPGRFGPFANNEEQRSQAGTEAADYTIQKEDAAFISVRKNYQLKTPAAGDDPALEMSGGGTWTFNRKDKMPESLDLKYKLLIIESNTQTTVPISITMKRVSKETLAKLDQEAQQRMKEAQEKAQAAKMKAEAPLTADEKNQVFAGLRSADSGKVTEALKFLREKSPKEPESDVAAAIEPLLNHSNPKIKDDAKAALRKWSPEFDRKIKLNEAYSSHMPVESTDRYVESTTPLYVGQILQFQEHGSFWYAGEVLELLTDGKVKVRKRGFAPREHVVTRRNLQLAPDEVEQPRKPESAAPSTASTASATGVRTWVDASGEHRIEAVYLGFADGKVKLRRTDNKEITVPLDKLSKADQQHVEKLQAVKKTPNPFE